MMLEAPRPEEASATVRRARRLLLLATAMAAAACATLPIVQGRYRWLGPTYPSLSQDRPVEVFWVGMPARPFVRVSHLDVHIEKTDFGQASFGEALPELKKQARLSGADAIIEIEERRAWVVGTPTYNVAATGVRYTDEPER